MDNQKRILLRTPARVLADTPMSAAAEHAQGLRAAARVLLWTSRSEFFRKRGDDRRRPGTPPDVIVFRFVG